MEHLTTLQSLKIWSRKKILSLPVLPQSIKKFELRTSDEVLVSSCITAGDPDWQKIKHIPYMSIVGRSHCVMKMGVVQGPKQMGSEEGASSL